MGDVLRFINIGLASPRVQSALKGKHLERIVCVPEKKGVVVLNFICKEGCNTEKK